MTTVVLNTVTRKVEVFSSARDVQARAEIADHQAAADPHPQYLADADLADVALSGDAGDLTAGTLPDARMPNWTGYNVASRAALEAANVPAAVDGLRLLGHATVDDGGGARYKRVASEPIHAGKIQSADGAWWEIAEPIIHAEMLGAVGDGTTDNTTALSNFLGVIQAVGGEARIGPGTFKTDLLQWNRTASGAHCTLRGAGLDRTVVQKLSTDGAGLFEVNENTSDTQQFSSGITIEGIDFVGVAGNSAFALRLKSLTASAIRDIRAKNVVVGIDVVNCITNVFENCVATANTTGWRFRKATYGDATGVRANLNTMVNCKATINSGWGMSYEDATLLNMIGCQIEENGTGGNANSGGMTVTAAAGDLTTNREGISVAVTGCWFEANVGGQAVRLLNGLNVFTGCQWVANSVRELLNVSARYELYGCSMVNDRTGGNVLDDVGALPGNVVLGGEITNISGFDLSKTDLFNVNSGNSATAVRNHRVRGYHPLIDQDTSQHIVQQGSGTCVGGTVNITFPVAFGSAPRVVLQPKANAATRIYSAKAYSITATGFTAQMQYIASGSATVVDSSDTFDWIAVGQLA